MSTKSEMAVAVAKDVIKQLGRRTRGFTASHRGYVISPHRLEGDEVNDDLKDHVDEIQGPDCHVCALGAALLCKARLFDNVPLRDVTQPAIDDKICIYPGHNYVRKCLKDVFSPSQLDMIESAYEKSNMAYTYKGMTPSLRSSIVFGYKYDDSKRRMKAIMENIIANNGKFCPPTVTKQEYEECLSSTYSY